MVVFTDEEDVTEEGDVIDEGNVCVTSVSPNERNVSDSSIVMFRERADLSNSSAGPVEMEAYVPRTSVDRTRSCSSFLSVRPASGDLSVVVNHIGDDNVLDTYGGHDVVIRGGGYVVRTTVHLARQVHKNEYRSSQRQVKDHVQEAKGRLARPCGIVAGHRPFAPTASLLDQATKGGSKHEDTRLANRFLRPRRQPILEPFFLLHWIGGRRRCYRCRRRRRGGVRGTGPKERLERVQRDVRQVGMRLWRGGVRHGYGDDLRLPIQGAVILGRLHAHKEVGYGADFRTVVVVTDDENVVGAGSCW